MQFLPFRCAAALKRRAQRGQTLVIFAFLSVFLIVLLGLVVDSVRLYILTAQAERTAEASALAGALYMPNYYNTPAPSPDNQDAVLRVCALALQNGITNCPAAAGTVGALPSVVAGNIYELQVTITLQADVFFLNFVSPNLASATISRSATAQFLPPIALGSRSSAFGDESPQDAVGGVPVQSFWARINGPLALQENGDAFTPTFQEGPTDPIAYPDGGNRQYNRWTPAVGGTNHQQWPAPIANPDQHPAGFTGVKGTLGYNYEIVVPPGAGNVEVQLYNPAFDAQKDQNAVGFDDLGNPACDDPAFGSGGTCTKTDQKSEYLQMTYSLYSAPLLFERGTDSPLANFSPPSLDLIPGDLTRHGCNGSTPNWNPETQACVANPSPNYIENWYPFFTITNPGTYRLSVEATGFYGEHEYGIKLTDPLGNAPPPGVRIWAWNDMAVYFTTGTTNTVFDLGEIPAAYAGKTLNFSLFDPGDGSNVGMSILDPSGTAVQLPAWVRTTGGSGGTEINASQSNDHFYNGLWLHLPITIPPTYNPAPGSDWWQIQYNPHGTPTNDTITISISLSGSPIHLISEVV